MAVVSRALAFGWRRNLGFIAGMVIGDLTFIVLAVFGLSALAEAFEGVFEVIRYAGAAYLVWLGIKAWRTTGAGAAVQAGEGASQLHGLVGGLVLTLANPKTIVFYVALLPAVVDLSSLNGANIAVIMALAATLLSTIMLCYSLVAARARTFLRDPGAGRALDRAAGTILIGVGLTVALRAG